MDPTTWDKLVTHSAAPNFDLSYDPGDATGASFLGDISGLMALPKQQFRGLVGLNPQGSAAADLQSLGMSRVPAAFVGSALDTLADPTLLAGSGNALLNKIAGMPTTRALMAGESGAVDVSNLSKFLRGEKTVADLPLASALRAHPEAQAQRMLTQLVEGGISDPTSELARTFANPANELERMGYASTKQAAAAQPLETRLGNLFDIYTAPEVPGTAAAGTSYAKLGWGQEPPSHIVLTDPRHMMHEIGHTLDAGKLMPPGVANTLGAERVALMEKIAPSARNAYQLRPDELMAQLFAKAAEGKASANFPQTLEMLRPTADKITGLRGVGVTRRPLSPE